MKKEVGKGEERGPDKGGSFLILYAEKEADSYSCVEFANTFEEAVTALKQYKTPSEYIIAQEVARFELEERKTVIREWIREDL